MSITVRYTQYMEDDETFVYSNPDVFQNMDMQIGGYLFEDMTITQAKRLRKQLKHAIDRIEEKRERS